MAIWLTKDSKVIVQGITGAEGTKHTRRMLASGTNVVGGINPRKAGTTGHRGPAAGVREVSRGHEADRRRRVGRLRAPGVHQGRRARRPSTRRSRSAW